MKKIITFRVAAVAVIMMFSGVISAFASTDSTPGNAVEEKIVALTFDDGPSATTTDQVLDRLQKYDVTASFFVIGKHVNDSTIHAMKRAHDMGCEINSHSFSHVDMRNSTPDSLRKEMSKTDTIIRSVTGRNARFFRPVYLYTDSLMFENIDKTFIAGLFSDTWGTAEERASQILAKIKPGCVFLLHDWEGNTPSVEALDIIIPKLLEDGYKFVTVSELFDKRGVKPVKGKVYTIAE